MLELFMVKEIKPAFLGEITFGKTFLKIFFHQQIHTKLYILLFDCPTANFGSLVRGKSHPPDVNLCVLTISTQKSLRSS